MCGKFLELAQECLSPLSDPDKQLVSSSAFTSCLELLPAIMGAMHTLGEEEEVGDLLDEVFNVRWEHQHVLPMTNLMSELYPYLAPRHLEALKVRAISCMLLLTSMIFNVNLFSLFYGLF